MFFSSATVAVLGVDHFAVGLEEAHLLPVGKRLDSHAVGLLRRRIPDRDLAHRQRHFLLDDAARHVLLGIGLLVALDLVDVLNKQSRTAQHAQHRAAPALVTAGEHYYLVTL